ncbi:hypothetical protein K443DRAFT_674001 [Laccaria amethystina LaAM-08-1]|uniref:Coiled-coil domain-containing protein 58 n=1 Tax=Laccaria amethystina LaAM-08-1 TaxID=1095629 RepID=A0A0C9YF24_9AGAR|nr:hypothetical protein K443DRAFT_674001 [Laccaria amethystina LaAM-08-1]
MPSKPQLGSLAVQTPSSRPQVVNVSPSTCHDLSLFKEILREYRKLDDTITMRLNRANAAMRDQERTQDGLGGENVQNQACAYLWRELVGNWRRRTQLVEYCANVVDEDLKEKRNVSQGQSNDPISWRKTQVAILVNQVKRNQLHNELTVEAIIRKRSVDAFRSRCRYFVPPLTDAEARTMWNSGQ